MSYTLNEQGRFDPEYAEVFGVPFSFIPCAGSAEGKEKKPAAPKPGRLKAVPERLAERPGWKSPTCSVTGYRYDLPPTRLEAAFVKESQVVLSTQDIPTARRTPPSSAKRPSSRWTT